MVYTKARPLVYSGASRSETPSHLFFLPGMLVYLFAGHEQGHKRLPAMGAGQQLHHHAGGHDGFSPGEQIFCIAFHYKLLETLPRDHVDAQPLVSNHARRHMPCGELSPGEIRKRDSSSTESVSVAMQL